MLERRFGSIRRMPRRTDNPGSPTGRWQIRYRCPTCRVTHPGELTFEDPARLVKTPDYPDGVPGRALKKLESVRDDMQRAQLAGVRYRCFRTESDVEGDEATNDDHGLPDAAVPTFEEYARAWQAARAVTKPLKARTLVENLRLLRNEDFPTFGRTPITKIAVEDVDRWWAKLLKKHPTRNKRNRDAYGILKQAMGAAVRDRRYPAVVSNPCQVDPDDIPKCKAKKMQIATIEEIEALALEMPDRLKLLVFLAAWSGLRYGELVELRRRDIDLGSDLPLLRVERAYSRVDGRDIVDDPKSEAGKRSVRIPDFLKKPLRKHIAAHAQPRPDGLIFTAARFAKGSCDCGYDGCIGGHLLHATFHRSYFRPARAKGGCPKLRVHDLRHTGATLAAQHGATLAELMRRIGHSTPQAAMIYQHATDERDEELARRMSKAARKAKKKAAKKAKDNASENPPDLAA